MAAVRDTPDDAPRWGAERSRVAGTPRSVTLARPVLIVGGGLGGLAAALAVARLGVPVEVFEQASTIGEIGAGIQLGPNAFAALDALGIGDAARALAVYTERMVLMDAVDDREVASVAVGDAFRRRFGNPYAVVHRADVHRALVDGVERTAGIVFHTATRIAQIDPFDDGVAIVDQHGERHEGVALIGCDGVRSAVRQQLVGDPVRVSGHVVYRAVVDAAEFPADLAWNAPVVWGGPDCHLVHYPLRRGEQYNVVVTFHSDRPETWGVTEGSREEVARFFQGIAERPRQLLDLPRRWTRWATADRDPVGRWGFGRATLLGDAAHPMLQYLAQGACMALEDAVTVGEAARRHRSASGIDWTAAFAHYERSRVSRTARVVLSAREMGRIYHAKGVERLVRNDLWRDRGPERFHDALEWLYGWRAEHCLAA